MFGSTRIASVLVLAGLEAIKIISGAETPNVRDWRDVRFNPTCRSPGQPSSYKLAAIKFVLGRCRRVAQ